LVWTKLLLLIRRTSGSRAGKEISRSLLKDDQFSRIRRPEIFFKILRNCREEDACHWSHFILCYWFPALVFVRAPEDKSTKRNGIKNRHATKRSFSL
jgi:hypothetical protein